MGDDEPNTGAPTDPAVPSRDPDRVAPLPAPTASADIRAPTPIIVEGRWAQMLVQCRHDASGRPIRASPCLAALAAVETGATLLLCTRPLIGYPQVEDAGVEVILPDDGGFTTVCAHIRDVHGARRAARQDGAPRWHERPPVVLGLDLSSSQTATLVRRVDQTGLPARLLLLGAYGTAVEGDPDPAELAAAAMGRGDPLRRWRLLQRPRRAPRSHAASGL